VIKEKFARLWPFLVLPVNGVLLSLAWAVFYLSAGTAPQGIDADITLNTVEATFFLFFMPYFYLAFFMLSWWPYSLPYMLFAVVLFIYSCRVWRRRPGRLAVAGTFLSAWIVFMPSIIIWSGIVFMAHR
jgi:hypothetical protein